MQMQMQTPEAEGSRRCMTPSCSALQPAGGSRTSLCPDLQPHLILSPLINPDAIFNKSAALRTRGERQMDAFENLAFGVRKHDPSVQA